MKHPPLTLNWNGDSFQPDTPVLKIKTGDTISFKLGATAPPKSTFLIEMDPRYFSPAKVKDSNTEVKVLEAAATKYKCHLLDEFGTSLTSKDNAGASTEPIKTKGA